MISGRTAAVWTLPQCCTMMAPLVLNAPDRNNDAAKLLNWGFSSFEWSP